MAMRAIKHGPDQRGLPPPLGPAPKKAKSKAKVLRFPNAAKRENLSSLVKGIRMSMPARVLTDLEFACEYNILMARQMPVADAALAAAGNGGSGGDKEWRPTWNWNYGGGNALWNLLANAELMTPVGRKFIPDPDYKGSGLSPSQRDPLHTAYDNVVKLSAVRASALAKTQNSERSRGNNFKTVRGSPPDIVGPVQQKMKSLAVQSNRETSSVIEWDDNRTKDWGRLDLSAFGWFTANDDTLSGDTDSRELTHEEKHQQRLENMAYFPTHVGTQLSLDDSFKLSPRCTVEPLGRGMIKLEYQLDSGYTATIRMSEEEFYYRLDDGGIPFNAYLWKELTPVQLMDVVVYDMFQFTKVFSDVSYDGFQSWTNGDLAKLFHWHNHSHWVNLVERTAVFEGIDPPVSEEDWLRWEIEDYHWELDRISLGKQQHQAYLQSMAKYQVFAKPLEKVERVPYKAEQWRPGTQKLSDDNRYQLYWLHKFIGDEEFRLEYKLAKASATSSAYTPAPVKEGKVKASAKKLWKFLNTPISDLFGKPVAYEAADPIPEPELPYVREQEKIDTMAEELAVRRIYLGSIHDDQYDLAWLEKMAGQKLDPNKGLPDAVQLAIKAVEQDVPVDEFSETGIYLGKTVQLPRTEAGLILLTHMPNSEKGSSPIAA